MTYIYFLIIYIGLFAILSLSLNLVAGYTGLLSLCHAAFFGIGLYATAILLKITGVSFWLALPLAGLVSAIFGFLIGLPTLRLKGDYLAIATLGFGQMIQNLMVNLDGKIRSISNIPPPKLFGLVLEPKDKWIYIILFWGLVLITWLVIRRIVMSRFGRALNAVREDEIAAKTMGINTTKYKVTSLVIGAFFAGLAGSLWAVYKQSATPDDMSFMMSVMILCMVVLGGMGNQLAVILGAAILVAAAELPRLTGLSRVIPPQTSQILFGLILVLMMIFRPDGILGRKVIHYGSLLKRAAGIKDGP